MPDLPPFPPLDRDTLLKLLNNYQTPEANYATGLEMLKEKMVPAILGHDYVPPYAKFDDSQTSQNADRRWFVDPSADYLKGMQRQFEANQANGLPDQPAGWPAGWNGNNRT